MAAAAGRHVGAPLPSSAPSLGLWYGKQARMFPTTDQLIHVYQVNNIKKMFLCCDTLQDCRVILGDIYSHEEVEIQVVLYIPTPEVREIVLGKNEDWIQMINEYQPVISYVCLGNVEEMNNNEGNMIRTAMDKIHNINSMSPIKMSTLVDVNFIFGSYKPRSPPSGRTFDERFTDVLSEVFKGLVDYSSPLLVKTFPNCAIGRNTDIAVDNYLLRESALTYMTDHGYEYKYVFDAMVDSISCAIDAMKIHNVGISVVSGWPTAGSREATITNAQEYNNNLLRHVQEDTPRKTKRIDHFIFSMVDEDMLTPNYGGIDWRHFGTFTLWKKETFPTIRVDDSAEAP